MLYSMKELLVHAQKHEYAVGYFEAFNMDCMEAVLNAAEKVKSPVIIGFGGQFVGSPKRNYQEDIYLYGALAKEAALRSKVPTAVILNEADEEEMIYQGMNAGFNTVMYQKEGEPFEETVRITKEICRAAHFMGIEVESEVGELPCADISTGTHTQGHDTDVEQAKYFVQETGIDALAVAIGNVHLLEDAKAELNYDLLQILRKEISIPLVLHGGTGVSVEDMRKAIRLGISKVNVGTMLKRAYLNAISEFIASRDLAKIDPHITMGWGGDEDLLSVGREAVTQKTIEFIEMFNGTGKADLF